MRRWATGASAPSAKEIELVDAHRRRLLDAHGVEVEVVGESCRPDHGPVLPRLHHVADRGLQAVAPGQHAGLDVVLRGAVHAATVRDPARARPSPGARACKAPACGGFLDRERRGQPHRRGARQPHRGLRAAADGDRRVGVRARPGDGRSRDERRAQRRRCRRAGWSSPSAATAPSCARCSSHPAPRARARDQLRPRRVPRRHRRDDLPAALRRIDAGEADVDERTALVAEIGTGGRAPRRLQRRRSTAAAGVRDGAAPAELGGESTFALDRRRGGPRLADGLDGLYRRRRRPRGGADPRRDRAHPAGHAGQPAALARGRRQRHRAHRCDPSSAPLIVEIDGRMIHELPASATMASMPPRARRGSVRTRPRRSRDLATTSDGGPARSTVGVGTAKVSHEDDSRALPTSASGSRACATTPAIPRARRAGPRARGRRARAGRPASRVVRRRARARRRRARARGRRARARGRPARARRRRARGGRRRARAPPRPGGRRPGRDRPRDARQHPARRLISC